MSQAVLLYIDHKVAHIRLNRADKHNALDIGMFEAIAQAQKQVAKSRDLRAVVLSGEGVDFCTGLDVKSVMRNRSGMLKLLWKWLPWQANPDCPGGGLSYRPARGFTFHHGGQMGPDTGYGRHPRSA